MGFPTGISGGDLIWRGESLAMKFGTRFAMSRRVAKLERLEDGGFCATFDGGNSAGQAAMFLSRSASRVRLLVRGPSLAGSMSHYLSSRLAADPAITIEYGAEVVALRGQNHLEGITVCDAQSGQTHEVDTRALFIMVGAAPNSGWLSGLVALDAKGFVLTGPDAGAASPFATSQPGIFAVGDVRATSVKRVASAVGEGLVVISKVWDFVNTRP